MAAAGLAICAYKVVGLGFPLVPGAREARWDLEIRLRFAAADGPVKAVLAIPQSGEGFAVVDENFISPGWGMVTSEGASGREVVWSIHRAGGEETLYYRAVLQRLAGLSSRRPRPPAPLALADLGEPQFAAAYAVLSHAVERSADLGTLIAQVVQRLRDGSEPNVALLVGRRPSEARRLEAAVLVLGLREIPARVVQGVRLEERRRDAPLVDWLEVWDGDEWLPFDPATGGRGVQADVLPLALGSGPLAQIDGAEGFEIDLAVRESEQTGLEAATVRGSIVSPDFLRFSLHGLPIQTQEVYRVLLMVPVGALLLVLLRGLIGIKTFGTFMPVLIALAFRETRLGVGIVLFLVIVALGLALRSYLERLHLLMVPRLAAVLTMVVLLMLGLSILSQRLSIERGLSVALFPMVILTMTIERMSLVWEERGGGEALEQAAGTLLAAVLAYLAMSNRWLAHWSFVFPELLLVVLAGCLAMGCYSGYRLLELWRFRELARGNE